MIAIIDYEAGNIASVSNAFERLGVDYLVTDRFDTLEAADGIVFPGVGHAEAAMRSLMQKGLDTWLKQCTKPVLGICVGLQLMYEWSEESELPGLGIFRGKLHRFDDTQVKVPHIGWNQFTQMKPHPLLIGLDTTDFNYFVHSYYPPLGEETLASCTYQVDFTAVAAKDQFMGVQYHPEKSGSAGALLLRNFLNLVHPPLAL